MGYGLLVLVVALGVVALYPTRRLALAGWPPGRLGAYWLGLILLGLLVAEVHGPARYLVPLYVAAYIAPFVTLRAGLDRLLGRDRGPVVRPGPIRRVGPEAEDAAGADAEEGAAAASDRRDRPSGP